MAKRGIASLEQSDAKLNSTLEDKQSNIEIYMPETANLGTKAEDLTGKAKAPESEIATPTKVDSESQSTPARNLSEKAGLENRIEEWAVGTYNLKTTLHDNKSEIQSLKSDNVLLGNKIEELRNQVETAQIEMVQVKKAGASSSIMLNQSGNEVRSLPSDKVALEKQVNNLVGKEEAMEKDMAVLKKSDTDSRVMLDKDKSEM